MSKINSTLIIAEAGVNHNGDISLAKEMIDCAAECGADAIKFQTFVAEETATPTAGKADYQLSVTSSKQSQLDMLRALELDFDSHIALVDYCKEKKIAFASTAFDRSSLKLLTQFELPFYKIPSGEITNMPLIRAIGNLGAPIILSTGASTLEEVTAAVELLRVTGNEDITLLHCTTEYPADKSEVNLRAMQTMGMHLGLPIGYSDHTMGIEISIAAVAMGATVIEKHFTLDRTMSGPDHQASLEPDELSQMVAAIRNIEKSFGDGVKKPSDNEKKNIPIIRRSIVAAKAIKAGELFTEENLTVKRPLGGRSPMEWDAVIGGTATRDYTENDWID